MLKTLDRLNWTMLANWQKSFFSKALMALSISALFLANIAPLLERHGIAFPHMPRVFLGSIIYLVGCLVFRLAVPSQLSHGGEIYDIVRRMKTLTDWKFFVSYRDMANKRVERIANQKLYPSEKRTFLQDRSATAISLKETPGWIDQTAGLYQAYVQTLDYDRPVPRLLTALLLAGGTVTLFWPVATNILEAAMGFAS